MKRLYVISLILSRNESWGVTTNPTVSWRLEESEAAALGETITWAMGKFPGFGVISKICHAIPDEHIAAAYAEQTHPTTSQQNKGDA